MSSNEGFPNDWGCIHIDDVMVVPTPTSSGYGQTLLLMFHIDDVSRIEAPSKELKDALGGIANHLPKRKATTNEQ